LSNNNLKLTDKVLDIGLNTNSNAFNDDFGYIQTTEFGIGFKDLILNPHGGNVLVGTSSPGAANLGVATTTPSSIHNFSVEGNILINGTIGLDLLDGNSSLVE